MTIAILCGCLLLTAASKIAAQSLEEKLAPVLKAHRGKASAAVKHLTRDETFAFRADEPMPTASLIKLPVLIETYRQAAAGKVDLDKMVTLKEEDKVPGSGILTPHFSSGAQLSLRDAVRLMIAYSDNTATNLVLDQIGLKSTSIAMEGLGYPETKIHAKVYRRDTSVYPERSKRFGLGSTTASDMVSLLQRLHSGEFGEEPGKEMIDHLLACQDTTRFGRRLPPGIKLAHKTGAVTRVRTDAGIIFSPSGPIALCVLTDENEDRRWVDDNEGNRLCARVAKIVYDHFNPPGSAPPAPKVLNVGASGRLVEDLQRTLNARLSPSPELSIDGDFGPVTRAAVVRFQQSKNLPADGTVDEKTWKALGALVTSDEPAPDPEVVNSTPLPTVEADPLTGPPFVTCKAWGVADAKSGEFLWGKSDNKPLDIASTTKIMTAYLVLQAAAKNTEVLDETVVFSERADRTIGSSARIRAGESLIVRELLYGLMLPSGNDASVALGEHFGNKLNNAEDNRDPLDIFIAEMNRTAQSLGMENTTYRNTHGLTQDGHRSTVRDLLRLARAAMNTPLFADYVATRRRGCTLTGPGGYQRNIVWNNTNRLLPIEGYEGVKTGTTSAAGACLVSAGRRGEDRLLIVVLGSTSSDARYTDTRNLYRWAWNKRGE